MELHLANVLYLPRFAPRGKIAIYDIRKQEPLERMYQRVEIPPLDAILQPPGSLWIGECREEGEWHSGIFRLRPHLVEVGLVVQPLPWMPGLCFQLYNVGAFGLQLWGGTHFGDLLEHDRG